MGIEVKLTINIETSDPAEAERQVGELVARARELGVTVDKAKLTDPASGEGRKLSI